MLSEQDQALVEQNLQCTPSQVALRTGNRLVAQCVDTLQRARTKLPSYYDARCFILPISYEQSSSEVVAASRYWGSGEMALDLTCGLGVDSLYISKYFSRVVSSEIDPERAAIARYNFERLSIDNIQVRECSAQDLLSSGEFTKVDLIFCDPARRDDKGAKRHALEDCSPNIVELMPQMLKLSRRVMVKLSPLFDVAELFNIFGGQAMVEVISHRGECKEVVLHLGEEVRSGCVLHTIIDGEGESRRVMIDYFADLAPAGSVGSCDLTQCSWLYVADVALVKSRSIARYMYKDFSNTPYINAGAYVLSEGELDGFAGQGYPLQNVWEYKPKHLKKQFKDLGLTTATIRLSAFPYPQSQVFKQLALKEGSGADLFCFREPASGCLLVGMRAD